MGQLENDKTKFEPVELVVARFGRRGCGRNNAAKDVASGPM
jgi:hypothetical protein